MFGFMETISKCDLKSSRLHNILKAGVLRQSAHNATAPYAWPLTQREATLEAITALHILHAGH